MLSNRDVTNQRTYIIILIPGTNVLDDAEIFDEEFEGDGSKSRKRKQVKTSESIEWAKTCGIKDQYVSGIPESGYKIRTLLAILQKSAEAGRKLICFSQDLGENFCIFKIFTSTLSGFKIQNVIFSVAV